MLLVRELDVVLDPRGAARREAARLGQVDEVRHAARDDGRAPRGSSPRRGTEPISPWVYGWRRIVEQAGDVALLDDLAGVHHRHPVAHLGDHAEVMGDQDHGGVRLALERRA